MEHLNNQLHGALEDYKNYVTTNMQTMASDQKKLLSLPFYLAKRHQIPDPAPGQWQWALFEDLHGKTWDHFDKVERDDEKKITTFDFENFLSPGLLKHVKTDSPDFQMTSRR